MDILSWHGEFINFGHPFSMVHRMRDGLKKHAKVSLSVKCEFVRFNLMDADRSSVGFVEINTESSTVYWCFTDNTEQATEPFTTDDRVIELFAIMAERCQQTV